MVQLLDEVGFRDGALDDDLIVLVPDRLVDFLDGPRLMDIHIHGEIDTGHAALADELQDFVFIIDYLPDLCHFQSPLTPINTADMLSVSRLCLLSSTRERRCSFIVSSSALAAGRSASKNSSSVTT